MAKSKKPKPYNNGSMTEAGLRGMIVSSLRKSSRYFKSVKAVRLEARYGKMINSKTGRQCNSGICAICDRQVLESEMSIDHINPVVPIEGWADKDLFLSTDWTSYIRNLFVEKDSLQAICNNPCHDEKTRVENEARRARAKLDSKIDSGDFPYTECF